MIRSQIKNNTAIHLNNKTIKDIQDKKYNDFTTAVQTKLYKQYNTTIRIKDKKNTKTTNTSNIRTKQPGSSPTQKRQENKPKLHPVQCKGEL